MNLNKMCEILNISFRFIFNTFKILKFWKKLLDWKNLFEFENKFI